MDKLGNRVYLTLPAEDEDGSVEYKWCLVNSNSSRSEEFAREKIRAEPEFPNVYKRNKLSSQMRWRLGESPSKTALYVIGVHDNGQLTGLTYSDLIDTFLVLLDCARVVGIGLVLRHYQKLARNKYWAIVQAYRLPKRKFTDDNDIIKIPELEINDYLRHASSIIASKHPDK